MLNSRITQNTEFSELQAATDKTPKFTLKGIKTIAKVTKVYDGDTIHAVFLFGGKMQRFTVRMLGYNSAEIKGETEEECAAAQRAKKELCDLILDKIVNLEIGEFDKYGRLLGTVTVDGMNVNECMVRNGFGKPYLGHGEKLW